jgi:hypothetical protein
MHLVRYKFFYFLFLVFSSILFSPSAINAQGGNDIRISGTYTNTALIDFLKDIEKNHLIVFNYNPDWFKNDSISLFFNNTPLIDALRRAIPNKSVLLFQDSYYVLLPKEEVDIFYGNSASTEKEDLGIKIIGIPSEAGKYSKTTIKGTINDGKTGEPLIGSTIQVENTNNACVSNLKGAYALVLAPGEYNLIISNVGYEKTSQRVKVVSNGELNVELFEKSTRISDVVVYSQKADRNVRSSQMSIIEMDSKAIKQLPSLTGEKDVIKSFTMMPGVKSVGEFGAGIYVRGGSTDQNLFLIEGAPLFNTAHVFGLISSVNPDAVSNVTLYKGHIPSNFGERVSSVMDIQLKDNISKEFHVNGGVGLFSSRLMAEVPIYNETLSLKFGGRTNYSNWLLKELPDYNLRTSKIGFYDYNGILTWNYKNNRIVAFVYNSYDMFNYSSEMVYNYGSTLGSLQWSHYFSNNINTSISYIYSDFNMTKDELTNELDQSRIISGINYQGLKLNLTARIGNSHILDIGTNSILYNNDPGKQTPLNEKSMIISRELQTEKALENAVYINDKWEINSIFSINGGLRYSYYTKLGPGTVFNYIPDRSMLPATITDSVVYDKNKIIQSYGNIEPRVALKAQLGPTSSVKLSYNRNFQYISLISNTSAPSPNDVWKLADKYLKPIDCSHYAIGYYRNFNENKIETSVELYYKTLKDLVEYKNGAQLEMNKNIETELVSANGRNYGVELYVKKNAGEFDGWIAYTYSRSMKQTTGRFTEEMVNKNQYYPSSLDKPHDITIMGTWHINRRVRLSGNFNYSTGRSVTLPELKYSFNKQTIIQYSDRNKYRLPDYHRLDLSLSVDESLKRRKFWRGSWTFSILNVYAQKNIYSIYYRKETPTMENDYRVFSLYKIYIMRILPTFTYNFIF